MDRDYLILALKRSSFTILAYLFVSLLLWGDQRRRESMVRGL